MYLLDKLLGRTTVRATKYVTFTKPIDSKARKKLNKMIADNAGNTVNVGDRVRYLVDKADIKGAESDPQRPLFDNAVVTEIKKRFLRCPLACIKQDRKSIYVLPQLLKKL